MGCADQRYCLTLSCADKPGIVAAVTTCIAANGGNIIEAQQFDNLLNRRFFMRVEFDVSQGRTAEKFEKAFVHVADALSCKWALHHSGKRKRVAILVSRFDHCLADLLYRCAIGELTMDIVAIISNHPRDTFIHLDFGSVPFHFIPAQCGGKSAQEGLIRTLLEEVDADLVILARYMQILSGDMAGFVAGRCINIHHSFLPGFKGARPYHQAHARGVKLIGATAHFVTADLDEGPIIEQDVERVTHRDKPEDLIRKGRDIERRVLARAVRAYLENRILENGSTTIVFA